MHYHKYQALGNDYLVVEPAEIRAGLSPKEIRRICDRHYGVGSDGILIGPLPTAEADFTLRLYNPDGSEFEKSGNGLRIFARYLWDTDRVGTAPFTIRTPGGTVTARVHAGGRRVTIDMGRVSFYSEHIPVAGPPREVLNEIMILDGQKVRYHCATIGNPHCVLIRDSISADEARRWGPLIERAERFPNRTNVQFVKVLDRSHIQIEIWERGAGYTLASGSSSCAAAAVTHRLGLGEARLAVHMPGGTIDISIGEDWQVTMAGGVTRVCSGTTYEEMLEGPGGEARD